MCMHVCVCVCVLVVCMRACVCVCVGMCVCVVASCQEALENHDFVRYRTYGRAVSQTTLVQLFYLLAIPYYDAAEYTPAIQHTLERGSG